MGISRSDSFYSKLASIVIIISLDLGWGLDDCGHLDEELFNLICLLILFLVGNLTFPNLFLF